jgi:hypothetical protein
MNRVAFYVLHVYAFITVPLLRRSQPAMARRATQEGSVTLSYPVTPILHHYAPSSFFLLSQDQKATSPQTKRTIPTRNTHALSRPSARRLYQQVWLYCFASAAYCGISTPYRSFHHRTFRRFLHPAYSFPSLLHSLSLLRQHSIDRQRRIDLFTRFRTQPDRGIHELVDKVY